jgi:myo-inositol-hexaphosphate 3-phosphohydrolase
MNDTTTVTTDRLAADETNRLISSEKVEGTAVYDRTGQHLGSIHHVMIDKYDRNRLERALSYRASDMLNWSDRAYTSRIDKYWLPPV